MDGNNNETNVLINWSFAIWLFEHLMGLRNVVENGILPPQIYNWPITDVIQAVHDGGWDWSMRDLIRRPGHLTNVKEFITRNYPFLNFINASTEQSTLFGNQLQDILSQYLDVQILEQNPPQFGHLTSNHPVIKLIKAKTHLSSRGYIVKYSSLKKAYLRLHQEHKVYFSETITTSDRNASDYDGHAPYASAPILFAPEPINFLLQQPLPNNSLTNTSIIQQERDTDSEIRKSEFLDLSIFRSVSDSNDFRDIGSQFNDFPSSPSLEPLGHTSAQTLDISDTTVETPWSNFLPNDNDSIYLSYPTVVSAMTGLQQTYIKNTLSTPTNIVTIGPIDNYSNPNWYYPPLESKPLQFAHSASSAFPSSQQLSHRVPFMTTTQSSHDATSSPVAWVLSPPELAFTIATDSSTEPNANNSAIGSSSSATLTETQTYLTDIWDDLEDLDRDFTGSR